MWFTFFRTMFSVVLALLLGMSALNSFGEDTQDIPQESVDPTASLPKIVLDADYSPKFWHNDTSRTSYNLSVTNPYYAWEQANLFHVMLPYDMGGGMASGQGPAQVFNLLIFNRPWGRWGAGLNASLTPPRAERDGIQYGPALGFVRVIDKCNFGVLNLNYLNDDVSFSAAQIIAGCSIGNGWTLSSGNLTFLYNWRTDEMIEAPLSIQLGRVIILAGQPVQFYVNPRYNLQDTPGTASWTFSAGLALVASPFQQ